jgi:prefoldin subunit 5
MNGDKALEYLAMRIATLEREKAVLIAQIESFSKRIVELEQGGSEREKV